MYVLESVLGGQHRSLFAYMYIFSRHSASVLSSVCHMSQCIDMQCAWTKTVHKPRIHFVKSKAIVLATVCLVGFVFRLQIIGP